MDIDKQLVRELVPHYVAMLVVVFLTLAVLEAVVGRLDFWVELAIIFGIALAYRPIVTRLGVAPSVWED